MHPNRCGWIDGISMTETCTSYKQVAPFKLKWDLKGLFTFNLKRDMFYWLHGGTLFEKASSKREFLINCIVLSIV